MLTSARNPFEVVMVFAGLLAGVAGIAGLFSPVLTDRTGLLSIYGLHGLVAQVFYPCLVLGAGAAACSLLLRAPMTLLIERAGMIWLAALLIPYGFFLIVNVLIITRSIPDPSLVLIVGYGVACAARSLQITHDLQRYRRELQRITSGSR